MACQGHNQLGLEADFCPSRVSVRQNNGRDVRGGREWRCGRQRGLELPSGDWSGYKAERVPHEHRSRPLRELQEPEVLAPSQSLSLSLSPDPTGPTGNHGALGPQLRSLAFPTLRLASRTTP